MIDYPCVCVFASTYGVKSNLFRQHFFIQMSKLPTLIQRILNKIQPLQRVGYSPFEFKPINAYWGSFFFLFIICCERQCLHFSDANRILYWKLLFISLSILHSINSSAVIYNECNICVSWSAHLFSNRIIAHTDWLMSFKWLFTIEFIYFESFKRYSKY